MRIFFDFNINQRSFFCHELAKYWKDKYGIKDYAGMVVVKNGPHYDFLKNQKEIDYHFIDNRDEIEKKALTIKIDKDKVDEIEKKLGIPLWYFAVADRNIGRAFVKGAMYPKTAMIKLANQENIQKWIIIYYELINKRLNEFKPDAVVFVANASLASFMLSKICEIKRIPYFQITTCRVKNYFSIVKNNYKGINAEILKDFNLIINSEKPEELLDKTALDFIDSFRKNPKSPEFEEKVRSNVRKMTQQNIIKIIFEAFVELAKMIGADILAFFDKKKNVFFLRKREKINTFIFNIRKKIIIRKSPYCYFDKTSDKDKFVFFPLHINPEASTMIIAPNFVNQLSLIEIIAKNIPLTYKLYVKEHFPSVGTRDRNFYKELKKFPNVKLINPWDDTFELIKKSSLVMTISGTAGWEAGMLRKPVITFSETFYSKAGLATYCSDLDKLSELIKEKIWGNLETDNSKRDLKVKALVTAIIKNSIEVDADGLLWGKFAEFYQTLKEKREDFEKIAESFYKVF